MNIHNWYFQFLMHASISTQFDILFHNWYYHFSRNKLTYIFGIIYYVSMYFFTTDNKETVMKMCKAHIPIFSAN